MVVIALVGADIYYVLLCMRLPEKRLIGSVSDLYISLYPPQETRSH